MLQNAGAAVVADSKRNFVYGLHAVNAALERAPERVLELWTAVSAKMPERAI